MWSRSLFQKDQTAKGSTQDPEEVIKKPFYAFIVIGFLAAASTVGMYAALPANALGGHWFDAKVFPVVDDTKDSQADIVPSEGTNVQVTSEQTNAGNVAKLKINNQPVKIPESGTVSQTVETSGGTTKIDVSVNSNTSGSSQTETSSSIQLNTTSTIDMSSDTQ